MVKKVKAVQKAFTNLAQYWLACKKQVLLTLALLVLSSGQVAYCASKTLLVLGDSLSAEYGLTRGSGWVALMEQRLAEKKIALNVINASISGETSSGGKTRLPALLEKHKPNYLIIELGGNDGLRGLPLSAFQANLLSMVEMGQKTGAKVLLLGMQIPPNYGREYAQGFIDSYSKVAKKTNVPLVPFLLKDIAEQTALFQPDKIHPLAAAHPKILENVWPQVYAMVKSK